MNRDRKAEAQLHTILGDCRLFTRAECYYELSSTNDYCRELAEQGEEEGVVVLSESQTAGRGRLGRHFHSPRGDGLYMSILLRPTEKIGEPGLITACAAVAVWEAIFAITNVMVDIKWVNDLYYHNKKLCGILTEGQFNSSGWPSYMIVGVGINLYPPKNGYPPAIQDIATSLADISTSQSVDRLALCGEFVRRFAQYYTALPKRDFLDIYRKTSCILGREVSFQYQNHLTCGKAVSIDDQARLVVQTAEGTYITLNAGEVTLLRPVLPLS